MKIVIVEIVFRDGLKHWTLYIMVKLSKLKIGTVHKRPIMVKTRKHSFFPMETCTIIEQ